MFKHIKGVCVISLVLFLAGVFCLIFSVNEINKVAAQNSGRYDADVQNDGVRRIIIDGHIPMRCEYEYGDEFGVSVDNVNPAHIEVREEGDELYIDYKIKSDNMDRLFLSLINLAANNTPRIKITLPDDLTVADFRDRSWNYYFNFDVIHMINSRYRPDTKIEIILENK